LKQQRQRQIDILNAEIDTRLRSGDLAGARQQLDKIKQLGGDVTSASGKIDEEQKKRQAQLEADAVFQKAVQRYQHASGSNNRSELESARADLENIAKAGGSHATEAANDANQLTQQLAELTRPVPPPVKPNQVLPPAVDLREVRSEVRSVIQRYIDAFEHRDADALQQVWPKMGDRYSKFKTSFATASSIRMKLDSEQIDIAAGGDTAVATTVIAQDYTAKGQSTRSIRDRTVFKLSKSNGTWRIDDVQ
jgi:ketosteroid isomerase-like protein